MTVSTSIARVQYAGDGSSTVFAVPYYFLEDTHLRVVKTSGGADTVLVLNTGYTVSGAGNPAGGSITVSVIPVSGETITILRDVPVTQETDYIPNDPFPAESHERALDRATMQIQQLKERTDRAATLQEGLNWPLLLTPGPNLFLAWNSGGTGLVNASPVITPSGAEFYVDSIAALKGIAAPAVNSRAVVVGYYTPGDGGGGLFWWDAASTELDNGITVIQLSGGGTGRWKAAPIRADLLHVFPWGIDKANMALSSYLDTMLAAVNRALNEAPFDALPDPWELVDHIAPDQPAFGKAVNINSGSEEITEPHYAKDSLTVVSGDTIYYNGIKLTRVTDALSFTDSIRDVRAADVSYVTGRRYIASVFMCMPFLRDDVNGIKGPNNQFVWMRPIASNTTHGHGAKLVGPKVRRCAILLEASSATECRVIDNPATALSASAAATTILRWYFNGYGLGGTLPSGDFYIGGMQIEEAPDQTEKPGIALIGTSLDSTTSSLQHWTQERAWPRWLEAVIDAPVFNGAIGGQTSAQLDARFNTDIAPWGVNAKYCILAANVNDFVNGFSSAAYRANWLSMYNKAIAAGMIPIFVTPARSSTYNYANGASDVDAEIEYIKSTYPLVIDRDYVLRDIIDGSRLNTIYDVDGVHFSPSGSRAFGLMVAKKYGHLFDFNNRPSAYQKTEIDNGGIVQDRGKPAAMDRQLAIRLDSSVGVTTYREFDNVSVPIVIFEGTAGSAKTFQLPVPNYGIAQENRRANVDVRRQIIVNKTADAQSVSIQYYGYVSGVLTAIGGSVMVPTGKAYEIITDGTSVWRVE